MTDVLATATRPVMATHSSCRALHPHPRNLTDSQIGAIASTGGIVCLNAFGGFLAKPTVDSFLNHIEHAVNRIGPDAVGIGADFIDDLLRIVDPILTGALVDSIPIVPGLASAADLALLAERVAQRLGESSAQKVMGDNLIMFLEANLE